MSRGAQPNPDFLHRSNNLESGSGAPKAESTQSGTPHLPSPAESLAPTLRGWKLSRVHQTGNNPKVHLSRDGRYGASTSASDLVLFPLNQDNLLEIRVEVGNPLLKSLGIGNGGFSTDCDYFHLLISGQPGKLLRLHLPTVFQEPDFNTATQYPEFPSASGRHVFSPSGDFFLTYATSGYKVAIPRLLNPISDRIVINSGEPFQISGTPTIESIDDHGIKVAIGTLPDGERGSILLVRDLVTRQEYRATHDSEITALSFAPDDNRLWCGDKAGWITGYRIENGRDLNSSELLLISRCPIIGGSVTAILALPESSELIIGDSGGGIYSANLLGIENERGLRQIGTLEAGHATSISFCRATATLGLGLSTGGVAVYKR
jgi:hypothetical protein